MTAERWTQIRQLFDTAMEQPAGNRELYVRELSNQDSELREEALAMLRNSGDGGALLDLSLLGRQSDRSSRPGIASCMSANFRTRIPSCARRRWPCCATRETEAHCWTSVCLAGNGYGPRLSPGHCTPAKFSPDDTALCGLSGRAAWARSMRPRIWISAHG